MNRVLVQSIRLRMREQTTDRLLALWTTNDRVMWSPEAFEAVKSLLAERGVRNLPPQDEPAPIAGYHSPADDPAVQYAFGWLRPVLWVCIVIGAAALPEMVALLWDLRAGPSATSIRWIDVWQGRFGTYLLLNQIVAAVILPAWLLVAAAGCLRLKAWARPTLLLYAVASTAASVGMSVIVLLNAQVVFNDGRGTPALILNVIGSLPRSLALPAVLWILLRRPEIRAVFVPVPFGNAFEPLPAIGPPPNPTAP